MLVVLSWGVVWIVCLIVLDFTLICMILFGLFDYYVVITCCCLLD